MTGGACDWTWLHCLLAMSHQGFVYSLSWSITVGQHNGINYSVMSRYIFNSVQGWVPCVLDLVSTVAQKGQRFYLKM